MVRERRSPPLVLAVLALALVLLALPARASAEGNLQRPHATASLGSFGGVSYEQYEGFFVGRSSTGNYRVPYRLSAPADPGGVSRPVLVEPPHFAIGTALRDDWLGRRFLFERGFLHGAVGYSTSTFGGDKPTNRILDPQARGVFIHGGRVLPGDDGATDDEILVDFARALGSDRVAKLLLGAVDGRYLGGVSDSADTADRIVADGRASGVFDFVLSLTSAFFSDPQAALADGTYTGKVIAVQSQIEWSYARDDEDRGQTPDRYRHYVVPGTPHIPDGLCPGAFWNKTTPASWLPAARAHFLQAHEWVTQGVAPPPSTRLATTPAGDIARDPAGNALLIDTAGDRSPRLPYLELGEATFVTGFLGTYQPQPPPTIAQLGFASHADYLAAFDEALENQVEAGYILDEDAEVIRDRAALSPPATFTENYFARYAEFAASESCP